jgi:hemoglobin
VVVSVDQNVAMECHVFETAGLEQALLNLAWTLRRRCQEDPVAGHVFRHPGQHRQHMEGLAGYCAQALGRPATYTESIGDRSHVLRLRSGIGEHEDMVARAQKCLALAIDNAGLPQDGRFRPTLAYWFRALANG